MDTYQKLAAKKESSCWAKRNKNKPVTRHIEHTIHIYITHDPAFDLELAPPRRTAGAGLTP